MTIVSRVRIPSRTAVIVTLAVAAQVAIDVAPISASADGFGKGLPCRMYASAALVAPTVDFTAVAGRPYTPPMGEFTDGETWPAGNFSATANWGDGATSPGSVRLQEGCKTTYEASAPSHIYSTPGTYSFSYTIHDASTGLDHIVDRGTVNVVASPPQSPPPPKFKLVGQPILAAIPSVKRSTAYEIIFRLDQPLPRTKSGRILASLSGYGIAGSLASFGPHKSHSCYAAGITPPKGHTPRPHRRYPFAIGIEAAMSVKVSGHAVLHRYFNFVSMLTSASKKLAC
jgi:PKD repeat protein